MLLCMSDYALFEKCTPKCTANFALLLNICAKFQKNRINSANAIASHIDRQDMLAPIDTERQTSYKHQSFFESNCRDSMTFRQ